VVDDTTEAIIISGFESSSERNCNDLSLSQIGYKNGRIHRCPKCEEVVAKTEKNIEEEIVEIGERTCIDLVFMVFIRANPNGKARMSSFLLTDRT